MKTFLRYANDYLDQAKLYPSKRGAIEAYEKTARELARFGQRIEATLHHARNRDELQEYPDWILSLGPRGGVRCERT